MKLITKIQEIQDQVPVSMTTNIDTLKSFLASAESQFIKFMIGKEQYDVLVAAYNAAQYDTQEIENETVREAIVITQRVTANLAYLIAVPVLNVSVGPSGVQIFSNSDTKAAFQWQVEDLKKALQEIGFNAIEDLMDLLAEYPSVFPEYSESSEFRRAEKYLIRSAKEFNEYYGIKNSRYTFQMLLYIMGRVEKQSVIPVFGSAFFESLKRSELSELSEKAQELIQEYIKPGIALLVVAKASIERIVTLESGMALVNISGNYETVKDNSSNNREAIKDAAEQLTLDGNKFLQDGLTFLLANSTEIPGFIVQEVKRGRFKNTNNPDKGIFTT